MRRATALLATLALCAAASGCAVVKPWERDKLGRRDMAWEPDPMGAKFEGHIEFSKEAALPGGGGGGGGCGCN